MYLDLKGEISRLMICSFYMYLLSCIIMALWWPKPGDETSRRLISMCS